MSPPEKQGRFRLPHVLLAVLLALLAVALPQAASPAREARSGGCSDPRLEKELNIRAALTLIACGKLKGGTPPAAPASSSTAPTGAATPARSSVTHAYGGPDRDVMPGATARDCPW